MAVLLIAIPGAAQVYANEGPLINIGPPDASTTLSTILVDGVLHVVYEYEGDATYPAGIYYATVIGDVFGPSAQLNGAPQLIIPGGTDPTIVSGNSASFLIGADTGDKITFIKCIGDQFNCEVPEGEGTSDSCRDGIDNDFDGTTDHGDRDCSTNQLDPGLCFDGVDNDGDGKTDYDDPDCFIENEALQLNSCFDGVDNDGDGKTDSRDRDCRTHDDCEEDDDDCDGIGRTILDFGYMTFLLQSLKDWVTNLFIAAFEAQSATAVCDPGNPQVAADTTGTHVYYAWEDCGDIWFNASHDGGNSFALAAPYNLSANSGDSSGPRIAASDSGQYVHVIWTDESVDGFGEILYSTSDDFGETFNGGSNIGIPINLSNTSKKVSDQQQLAVGGEAGEKVYVVWVDQRTGNGDVYFRVSTDNGGVFGSTMILSQSKGQSSHALTPDIAAQGPRVAVVWSYSPGKPNSGEIAFIQSTDMGSTFGPIINLSNTPKDDSIDPQIDYVPGNIEPDYEIYVAWLDRGGPDRTYTPDGTFNVLAVESDDGLTFSDPVNLTDAENNPDPGKDASQLEVVGEVAVWDPSSRRG